jgi:hypothetical protein
MCPEDLLELLRARPFKPFRIHMTDGQSYEIVHPEAAMVLRSRAIVGLRPHPARGYFEASEGLSLLHIVRTSEIPAAGSEAASSPAN